VAAEPRGHRLVAHNLGVLVAREAQRHHEEPRLGRDAAQRVRDHRAGAEIDLGGFAGREAQDHRGRRRLGRVDRLQDPAHRRVAAVIAVLAHQGSVDRGAGDTRLRPLGDALAVLLQRRHACRRQRCRGKRRGQLGVVRQRPAGIEPLMLDRHHAQLRRLLAAHQPRSGDVAVGIALAHPRQDLSVLKHLEPPSAHCRPPPGQKIRQGSGGLE